MPAFKLHGRMLVYYASFKNHTSLFPASSHKIDIFNDELAGYKTSIGTIQFPLDKPIPTVLVKKIVKFRVKENLEKEKTQKKKHI